MDEAWSMKKVLENMKRILGEEHPDTISTTLRDQGKLDKAASMMENVLRGKKENSWRGASQKYLNDQ